MSGPRRVRYGDPIVEGEFIEFELDPVVGSSLLESAPNFRHDVGRSLNRLRSEFASGRYRKDEGLFRVTPRWILSDGFHRTKILCELGLAVTVEARVVAPGWVGDTGERRQPRDWIADRFDLRSSPRFASNVTATAVTINGIERRNARCMIDAGSLSQDDISDVFRRWQGPITEAVESIGERLNAGPTTFPSRGAPTWAAIAIAIRYDRTKALQFSKAVKDGGGACNSASESLRKYLAGSNNARRDRERTIAKVLKAAFHGMNGSQLGKIVLAASKEDESPTASVYEWADRFGVPDLRKASQ